MFKEFFNRGKSKPQEEAELSNLLTEGYTYTADPLPVSKGFVITVYDPCQVKVQDVYLESMSEKDVQKMKARVARIANDHAKGEAKRTAGTSSAHQRDVFAKEVENMLNKRGTEH